MSPQAVKDLMRLSDLVDSGVLPERAICRCWYHSYGGHQVVHTYAQPPSKCEYKCVTCLQTLIGGTVHECTGLAEVYETNHIRTARWKCALCSHQWDAEDGDLCPECLSGPLTGTLDLLRGPQSLPEDIREKYPVLRELNDRRIQGVPANEVIEKYAQDHGLTLDAVHLLVAMEWWLRVTSG